MTDEPDRAGAAYRPGRAAGLTGLVGPHRLLGAAYAVSLSVFEGPLDLLLHLIEQEKLDISEVSLVAVTDQYLRTLDRLEALGNPLGAGSLADFLVVASRLLYIKSTRLLPKPAVGDDEEEETADDLVRHLLEYRQFKRVAASLRARDDEGTRLFGRPANAAVDVEKKAPEFGELEGGLLQAALKRALARTPEAPPVHRIQPYAVTVADRIETVRALLAKAAADPATSTISFSRLLEDTGSRVEIIVTFLAVLELVKQAEVVAVQDDTFGEIMLARMEPQSDGDGLAPTQDGERDAEKSGSEEPGEAEDE